MCFLRAAPHLHLIAVSVCLSMNILCVSSHVSLYLPKCLSLAVQLPVDRGLLYAGAPGGLAVQVLSGGADGLLKMWNVASGECVNTFDEHEDKVTAP